MGSIQSGRRTPNLKGRQDVTRLVDIPNVGKATAADLRLLGIEKPSDLLGKDPYQLHEQLCRLSGQQHDPCVIDVFIAAIRFMEGGPVTPWWKFTAERKRTLASRSSVGNSKAT